MYNIQIFDKIAAKGLALFPKENYHVEQQMENPDAILVRSTSLHDLLFSNQMKVVGRAGVGVNNIPVEKLTQAGIPVLNTPGANANAVKELVLTGILIASRNIFSAWQYLNTLNGNDTKIATEIEKQKKQFVGHELLGKTLGVIGLGNIGVKVANAALALGMNVLGYDPDITVKSALALSSQVQQADTLQDLLRYSTFITIHIPLFEKTHKLINAERLQLIQPDAVLLNFAREEIVDIQAVHNALNKKNLAYYVTDFPNSLLLNHPQVIALPHLGASTHEAEENCAMMIVQQVRDYLENGNIKNSVNFPDVSLSYNNGHRLAIVNANVPNMVAQISQKLGEASLNIIDLINKSRDEIAYTLLDVNQKVPEQIIEKIKQVKGIITIRTVKGA